MKRLLFLLLTFFTLNTYAEKKIHISGIFLDIRFEYKAGSPYYELINKLIKRLPFKANFGAYPLKRASHFFLNSKKTCLLPTTNILVKTHYPKKSKDFQLIESEPIEHVTGRIFSRKGEKTVNDLEELNGKKLIFWMGMPASRFIPNVNFEEIKTTSEKQAISMLNAGRGDYLMGWTPDTQMVAIKNKLKVPDYNSNLFFLDSVVSMVCHDIKEGRIVIEKFNKLLKEMKASGELKKLFGDKSRIAL